MTLRGIAWWFVWFTYNILRCAKCMTIFLTKTRNLRKNHVTFSFLKWLPYYFSNCLNSLSKYWLLYLSKDRKMFWNSYLSFLKNLISWYTIEHCATWEKGLERTAATLYEVHTKEKSWANWLWIHFLTYSKIFYSVDGKFSSEKILRNERV